MADGQKSEAKKSSGAAKYKAAYKKSQLLIKKLKSKLEKLEESKTVPSGGKTQPPSKV